ncbi:MAG: ABC transporter substrate-binding protein [Herpetosiphon sp.]
MLYSRTNRPFTNVAVTLASLALLVACGGTPATGTTAGGPTTNTAANTPANAPAAQPSTAAVTSGDTKTTLGPIPQGPAKLSRDLVVALNTEITGAGAQTGDLAKKAADIAVEKINAAGGVNGKKIKLIVEDAASSNQGALAAVNKAGTEDEAAAMVGPVKSTQILAISERIKELQLPSLIGGTNESLTKQGNPWLLRFRPDDSIAATAMVNFALNDLKAAKIAVLHDSDAFGTGAADIIEAALKAKGKELATRQKYTTGAQDFTAQLLAVKSSGAEVLCLYGTNSQDDAVILRQAREQGLTIKLIGSPSYGQTIVADLAADLTEGVYVVTDYLPGRTPESKEYMDAWQKKYNSTPDGLSAWNWDAIHILSQIIARVGTDKDKIRAEILKVQGFKGAAGDFSFTPDGNGRHSVDIMQFKNKQPQFIRTVSANS